MQTEELKQASGAEGQAEAAPEARFGACAIISLMDLTALNETDTEASIAALSAKADTALGAPAALCIYRQFLPTADKNLRQSGLRGKVRLATVANFPAGGAQSGQAAAEVEEALALGADEVDIVLPYRALMAGDRDAVRAVLRACRAACKDKALKVILESGVLREAHLIRQAAELALAEGADFLKTSTGKAAVNATLPAAKIMLEAIAAHNKNCGFKAAGGVRTLEQAEQYLALAAKIMGREWINQQHFRFGASGLLDALLPASEVSGAADY